MIFFFVVYVSIRLINLHYTFVQKMRHQRTCPKFDACPMHLALRASSSERVAKFSARALDLFHFTRKLNTH